MDAIALLDQFCAGLRQRAEVLAGFREALLEQGFTREEALALCRDLSARIDATPSPEDGGE